MSIKKVDIFALTISIILNLMILLITAFTFKEDDKVNGKIQLGLVALEGSNKVNYEGKKDVEGKTPTTPPVEKKQEEVKKVEPPKPVQEVKPVSETKVEKLVTDSTKSTKAAPAPKPVEPKPVTPPKPVKKVPSLDDLNKKITAPTIDIEKKSSEEIKKVSNPITAPADTGAVAEAAIKTVGTVSGVPNGFKLGVMDGDVSASWVSSNSNPEYPVSAQLRGLHGTVNLRLTIDDSGNVIGVRFVKGSGVPEIDRSIEKVARTWKIPLKKQGKPARGEVTLEYKFKLEGSN